MFSACLFGVVGSGRFFSEGRALGDQQPHEVLWGVDAVEAAAGSRHRSAAPRPRLEGEGSKIKGQGSRVKGGPSVDGKYVATR